MMEFWTKDTEMVLLMKLIMGMGMEMEQSDMQALRTRRLERLFSVNLPWVRVI